MFNSSEVKEMISACNAKGYSVGMRDVAYVMLKKQVNDATLVYKMLFGRDNNFNVMEAEIYDKSEAMTELSSIFDEMFSAHSVSNAESNISFEENKAEIIRLIKRTKEALASGEIDAKDALKIESDLRVKLNDKFNVQSEEREQVIYVTQKYNDTCPYCSHEIARRPLSKEEAMEMYKLTEKK